MKLPQSFADLRRVSAMRAQKIARRLGGLPHPKHFYPQLAQMRSWSGDDVIFDIGANDGRTVATLMNLLPAPRIFAFEPVAATFDILRRQTARWPNVVAHPFAMGAQAGRAEIHLHDLSVMNSFVTAPGQGGRTESVEIRTVDGVMDDLGIDRIHFLKVDTEGFELDVLRGASAALAAGRIGIVQLEFHLDEAEGLQRLHDAIAPHGYELLGLFNQSTENRPDDRGVESAYGFAPKRLAYADAVYTLAGQPEPTPRAALF